MIVALPIEMTLLVSTITDDWLAPMADKSGWSLPLRANECVRLGGSAFFDV